MLVLSTIYVQYEILVGVSAVDSFIPGRTCLQPWLSEEVAHLLDRKF